MSLSVSFFVFKSYLKVFYPPTCERAAYHYMQANTDHIITTIDGTDWEAVPDHRDVNDQALIPMKLSQIL